MEYSTRQAIKYILTTFNDGKTNKLYDSTFRLRPPFKPNSNGQYKITINECLFQNNEPTLMKDVDYLEFIVYMKNGDYSDIKYMVNKDLYTFDDKSKPLMLKYITFDHDSLKDYHFSFTVIDSKGTNRAVVTKISLYDSDDPDELLRDDYYSQNIKMSLKFSYSGTATFADISKVVLKTSTNYSYLLNDLRTEIIGEEDSTNECFNFYFHNLRLGGPYLYVLKTPLQATVPTYNSLNQGYNVVACTYNPNGYHNSNVQMCSSMEVVTNDLSNFRIELVNDQYEPIRINTPIYLQITVSND